MSIFLIKALNGSDEVTKFNSLVVALKEARNKWNSISEYDKKLHEEFTIVEGNEDEEGFLDTMDGYNNIYDFLKDYTGLKWGDLNSVEKSELLRNANCVNAVTGEQEFRGECTVYLSVYPYSVAGIVVEGNIFISEDALIYNSEC